MGKLIVVIITTVLLTGMLTAPTAASSTRTGSASITWEREKEPDTGSSRGSSNRWHPFPAASADEIIVSAPDPRMILGRLPETGANYLIPLLLLAAGMSFLLVYFVTAKGNRSP